LKLLSAAGSPSFVALPAINFAGQEQPQLEFRGSFEDGLRQRSRSRLASRPQPTFQAQRRRHPPLAAAPSSAGVKLCKWAPAPPPAQSRLAMSAFFRRFAGRPPLAFGQLMTIFHTPLRGSVVSGPCQAAAPERLSNWESWKIFLLGRCTTFF